MSYPPAMPGGPYAVSWIGELATQGGSRYLQIAGFIEQAVTDERLRPGDRLPPQRWLAKKLGVDLTTVTRAYDEAKRRSLLHARGALGTYVASAKVELAQMLDLSMNIPPPPADVALGGLLKQGLAQVLLHTDADQLMAYHLGGGGRADRMAGAAWLAPMFSEVDPARIVVCPGAQAALAALILALTQAGDAIVAEPAVYPGLRAAAQQLGRRVITVQADEKGLRPDALERACRDHGARLVYLNPTAQNPTGLTMPEQRRREIARVARKCGARIIEDDPYWLLTDPAATGAAPAPIARFAPAQVYYISTLSKCLTPGLRTAFVLLPDEQGQDAFLAALRSFALMSTPLATALVTQWIHDGSAARLLAGVQAEARARRELARQILGSTPLVPSGGIHIWHVLPGYWTPADLARTARAEGLAVTASEAFYAGDVPAPNAIRISLGGVRERSQLGSALKKLSDLLARKPSAQQGIVI
jgi:DNA-binding transcriptional MocR family regulator